MVNKKTKFFVGLFVAGGIGIAVVAIIWLGMNRFFQKGQLFAVYFDESVQGLQVDSRVKYRGVDIGIVKQIGLAADSRLIEVVLMLETEIKPIENIVAQQKVVGISGSMFIELDRKEDVDGWHYPKLDFPTDYPVLASRPSDISELFHGVTDIMQKFNSLDIAGIYDTLKSNLDNINRVVDSADLHEISTGMKQTLGHLDQAIKDLDLKGVSTEIKTLLSSLNNVFEQTRLEKFLAGMKKDIESLEGVIAKANSLMENTSDLIDKTETGVTYFNRNLLVVGRDIEMTSRNLNRLIEQLADHPAQILFGEPPPRRLFDDSGGVEHIE